MKYEYSAQGFERYSNVKFNDNPSIRRRVVPCGLTERRDEANGHFLRFGDRD